jgi:hypothetical protein
MTTVELNSPQSVTETRHRELPEDLAMHRMCAWTGPAAVALAMLGMVIIGGYVPATDPAASGEAIRDIYLNNLNGIRFGMVISMIAFTLFVPFGIAIALQTRRMERTPLMSHIQVASVAIAALEGVMATVIWLTAAYRPDELPAEITRMLHDLGWICFLVDVPPFSVWLAAIGFAILRDNHPQPLFPRWLAYFNFWASLLLFPALVLPFFKSGPFAYNGILALYVPFVTFFLWMIVMTPALLKAQKTIR